MGTEELNIPAEDQEDTDFEDGDDKPARRKPRPGRGDWYEEREKLDRERTRRKARREKRRKGDLD